MNIEDLKGVSRPIKHKLSYNMFGGGRLTDCLHNVGEEAEGHQWLGELAEEQFQSPRDDVNVLPVAGVQIQLLFYNVRRGRRCRKRREIVHEKV